MTLKQNIVDKGGAGSGLIIMASPPPDRARRPHAHTDAVREYAYDRQSKIGRLAKALDEATAKGWTVVGMKNDWNVICPIETK